MPTSSASISSAGWSRPSRRNYPQREIADAAYALQREIDSGRRLVVGVNAFTEGEETAPLHTVDPGVENRQVERVQAVRARRDAAAGRGRRSPPCAKPRRTGAT